MKMKKRKEGGAKEGGEEKCSDVKGVKVSTQQRANKCDLQYSTEKTAMSFILGLPRIYMTFV